MTGDPAQPAAPAAYRIFVRLLPGGDAGDRRGSSDRLFAADAVGPHRASPLAGRPPRTEFGRTPAVITTAALVPQAANSAITPGTEAGGVVTVRACGETYGTPRLQAVSAIQTDQSAPTSPVSGLSPGQDGAPRVPVLINSAASRCHFHHQHSRTPIDCQAISLVPPQLRKH